jgi:hypothetical protein
LTLGNPLFLSQYTWEVSLHIFKANFLHFGLNGGHEAMLTLICHIYGIKCGS